MKIVIQTFGTRGDVQPFVALGRVLRARGHRVRIATCERFREFIEAHELDYGYINNEVLDFIESGPIKEMIDKDKNSPFQWVRAAISLMLSHFGQAAISSLLNEFREQCPVT